MRRINYKDIEERALANFELLLQYWKLDYEKISPQEYDFKNPTREDENYGACRFNVAKGKGADFAGISFREQDVRAFGQGFTKEDFAPNSTGQLDNWGFNTIGLCQRIEHLESYGLAATRLDKILKEFVSNPGFVHVTEEYIRKRDEEREFINSKKKFHASRLWNYCNPAPGTIGEVYLNSRSIFLEESEQKMRFHPSVRNAETLAFMPALLFMVEKQINDGLVAVHRIYLKDDGSGKADVENPKMALGSIKGAGIWFGKPDRTLYIAEGPENALSLRSIGYRFVVSTISAANFGGLALPDYIDSVVLCPDNDNAGRIAAQKAYAQYSGIQKRKVTISYPSGPFKDWNDMLKGV